MNCGSAAAPRNRPKHLSATPIAFPLWTACIDCVGSVAIPVFIAYPIPLRIKVPPWQRVLPSPAASLVSPCAANRRSSPGGTTSESWPWSTFFFFSFFSTAAAVRFRTRELRAVIFLWIFFSPLRGALPDRRDWTRMRIASRSLTCVLPPSGYQIQGAASFAGSRIGRAINWFISQLPRAGKKQLSPRSRRIDKRGFGYRDFPGHTRVPKVDGHICGPEPWTRISSWFDTSTPLQCDVYCPGPSIRRFWWEIGRLHGANSCSCYQGPLWQDVGAPS